MNFPTLFRFKKVSRFGRWTLLVCALSGTSLTGCGNTLYLVKVHQAEQKFEEAKELGAEQHAPYEYYSAKTRLEETKRQAAAAEYGNASNLSQEATDYSVQAISISKTSRNQNVAGGSAQ